MSVRVDVEEIQTTKSEKLLAFVLAVFLLIGGLWAYVKTDDYVREQVSVEYTGTAADRAAFARADAARRAVFRARQERRAALENLELEREAYRTALDAGRPAPALERAYRRAQRRFEAASASLAQAERQAQAAQPAADAASARIGDELTERERRRELITFVLRLVLAVAAVSFGYWLLARLRRRGSRYWPVAFSFVGFAAVLAVVLAGDYVTDYVDPLDLGPLVLSLFGIAATLLAFWALQRYLARRLPFRRARNRECPFCSYPVRDNTHCEGCGREVVAACSACEAPRRVGTPHCGACGGTAAPPKRREQVAA